jgi:hypothetical protein
VIETRNLVHRAALAAALAATTGACTGDIDPPWQLDHNRIVAVRADPPAIASGQRSTIDALIGVKGGMTSVASPEQAAVVSPSSLSDLVTTQDGHWVVTAPDDARLAQVRTQLALAANAPVPLEIGVSYADGTLTATKSILLGLAATNPPLLNIKINGQPPPADGSTDDIVVAPLVMVPLSVDNDDVTYDVTWLTSCGTMHDFDLPQAYLKVEADDPQAGQLGIVVRDASGGVSWKLWPIHATAP